MVFFLSGFQEIMRESLILVERPSHAILHFISVALFAEQ
jgi:hypothetical protein